MKRCLIVLVCLSGCFTVLGQSLKDTVKLNEVFVSSKRQVTERAFYLQNIDSIVLANATSSNLSELLLKNSSLYIKSYGAGGLATASFRGTSASHTQVLWNGLNINSPLWGQTDLSMMPVFFTDEVSLFYGSSSLVKTSGGLGGCINLSNSPEWNGGTEISFSQTAGSFGYFLSQLKVGFSTKKFVSNTRLFLDRAKNNFRFFNDGSELMDYMRQTNANYNKEGFLQELYYKINSRQFAGLKIMTLWNDRNIPPIMSFRETNENQRSENQRDNIVNLMGEWKMYGFNTNLSIHSGYIRNSLDYVLFNNNPGGTVLNYDTRSVSNTFANRVNFQYNASQTTVVKLSADATYTTASYSDTADIFNVDRSDISAQVSLHHTFNPLLSGYILTQQKFLDSDFMPFIAAVGMEYQIMGSQELILKANMGRNLHLPTLNDMYFKPGGNLNLKSETGYQADAGVELNILDGITSYQVTATGFSAWIENWILWQPSEYRYWTANNVQKVFSRGAEINVSMKGEFSTVKYQIKSNYSFTRTTNEEKLSPSYGMQLIYIPKHIANAHLFVEKNKYSGVISWHITGPRYTSTAEDNVHRMPSYYLLDAGVGKIFQISNHSLEVNFKLNNILNKQYQVIKQRAMPGRNFSITVAFNFNRNNL